MVPMRDGVQLATDVYRLEGAAPLPVLLARTPYDKEQIVAGGDTFSVLRAVQARYVVVVQDVRGRYASEGAFRPHAQETQDGFDAIAWAAAQPWSNGTVGMFGGSISLSPNGCPPAINRRPYRLSHHLSPLQMRMRAACTRVAPRCSMI
jgi:putative CocE/NonD family hydrolase